MSRVLAPHLQRRDGVYYLRIRVPDAIRTLVGKTEIVRSLKTSSIRVARPRSALLTALVMEAFEMIKTTEITTHDARKLVQDCFVQLMSKQDAQCTFAPDSLEHDFAIEEQLVLSQERIADLKSQVEINQFDAEVLYQVRKLTTQHGFGPNDLSQHRLDDIANGVARVLVEQQRLFLLRIEDRLALFEPEDDLFKQEVIDQKGGGTSVSFKGPTLGDAVQNYLETYRTVWKLKTYRARVWQLGYLVEYLGAERPIASIKLDDIRSYRDAVLTLRANHGFKASQSFTSKQTPNTKARIQKKTASLIFQPVKTFFKRAMSEEGLIDSNPAQSIKIVAEKQTPFQRVRRPFEASEVERLFSCPLFTGCQSKHRRHAPGDKVYRDGKYWIPILGYYTGCRLGELVQLAIEDVCEEDGICYIDINENPLAGKEKKSVKSSAGHRKVPLHPDLIELGFLEFVAKRNKQNKPNERLFKEIRFGVDGQASTEYSKIFGRLMDKLGLTDSKLVFHSWRHGVEDALRDAGCQPYVIDRIIGHADTTMGGKYGKGVSLDVLAKAIANMKLPTSIVDMCSENNPPFG